MPDDQREVVIKLALDHFTRGLNDGFGEFAVKLTTVTVGHGAGLFDHAERAHDGDGLLFPTDGEVHDRALRLCAPILV